MIHKFIGVNGQIGTGKSEFAKTAVKAFPDLNVRAVKFAKPVYDSLYAINPLIIFLDGTVERLQYLVDRVGWEKAKEVPEVRRLLQRVGTEGGRDIHGEYCWIKLFDDEVYTYVSTPSQELVIADDLRFLNEVQYISDHDGITVKLFGPNRRSHLASALTHSSEERLPDKLFDYLIYNTGTLEQYQSAIKQIVSSPKPNSQVVFNWS